MPLTLVTGPANAGKAGIALDAYAAALAHDPVLVVPTGADAAHYRRELAVRGAVFGGQVGTFATLVRGVAAATGLAGQSVSPVQRTRLIETVVTGARFDRLARSAAAPGFAAAAGDLIAELQRALISPQRFTQALRAWAGDDAGRRRYADEVAGIYSAYRRRLERLGRVDDDLLAWRAADALRADPRAWARRPVVAYGFDDLTVAERDLLETLAGPAEAPVIVALAYEAGRAAAAGRATTYQELAAVANDEDVRPPRDAHYAPAARAALHHLERWLFEPAVPRVPAGDAVAVLEAGGERGEAELVAAEVLALLREGMPADAIAVVHRSPGSAAPLLGEVFAAYGIPHVVGWPVPFAHTPFGRGLCALLRCAAADGTADDVLAYLRAPGILQVPALADRVEAGLRRSGSGSLAEAVAAFEEIAFPLDALRRLRDASAAGGVALLDATDAAARRCFAAGRRRAAPVLTDEERPDADALRAALTAVRDLRALAAADPGTAPDAAALLATLERLEVRLGGTSGPGVRIAGPLDVRAQRFGALIVCGLQEGVFPAPGSGEPFLPDAVRREVNAATGLRLPLREDVLAAERSLFAACVTRAEAALRLSWRSSDEEGRPGLPSSFLEDTAALFEGDLLATPARSRPLAAVTWPVDEAPTASEQVRALAATGPRVHPAGLAALAAPAVLDAVAGRRLSPSALETYVRCPARWFVERVLRAAALAPDPEALRRGSLQHRALERILTRLRDETGSARVSPATVAAARAIAADVIAGLQAEEGEAAEAPATRAVFRALERGVVRYLERAVDETPWEPAHLEARFGFAEGAGPLVLGDGEDRVEVVGIVDRIDVSPGADGRAIVRDYKLSGAYAQKSWIDDGRLQVGLYLLAARRVFGLDPVAGLYQPLGGDLRARGLVRDDGGVCDGGLYPRDRVSAAEFDERLAEVEAAAVAAVAAMRAGCLTPNPDRCGFAGSGCAYPGICRSARA